MEAWEAPFGFLVLVVHGCREEGQLDLGEEALEVGMGCGMMRKLGFKDPRDWRLGSGLKTGVGPQVRVL